LRRTTPAMTTVILGVVLAALTVRAQQSSPSAAESPGQAIASNRTARQDSARKRADDQVYGISVTRGARFLLRNGIDYLNYNEYERALKFLREAETRKNELNNAERLVLQKGIETAQRGMRKAADAESPYALSERSRNRNGFSPAKPENNITDRTERSQMITDRTERSQMPQRKLAASTAKPAAIEADDHGEPILLASADIASINSNSENPVAARSRETDSVDSVVYRDSDRPRQFPDIPRLPEFSRRRNETDGQLTELSKSPSQIAEHEPERAVDQPVAVAVRRQAEATSQVSELPPVPVSQTKSALSTSELIQLTAVDFATQETPNPSDVNLGTKPLLPTVTQATHSSDSNAPPHKESEEPTAAPSVEQLEGTLPMPAVSFHSTPTAVKRTEDQPYLPADLNSKGGVSDSAKQILPPVTVQLNMTSLNSTGADDLPPLPADVSNSVEQPRSAVDTAPATTPDNTALSGVPDSDEGLPALPGNLSSQESQPGSARVVLSTLDAAQAASVSSPVAVQDLAVTPLGVVSEVSSSNPVGEIEKQEALPPLPTHTEKSIATIPPAASLPAPSRMPVIVGQSTVKPQDSLVTDTKTIDVSSHPTADNPNPEPAQESVVPASPAAVELSDVPSVPPAIENAPLLSSRSDVLVPNRPNPPSTLRPELKREVEMIVRKQEDELHRRQQAQPAPSTRDTIVSDLRAQTQLDISRAPSPAEARPIKAIPVPEDWVPLPPRTWVAQRKYWAAAATCHLPLYFQDPVLERYGHSVEQFVGPVGRYLTYPLDDPTQSTQRNQILQPFFSAGLFAFQIAALPYNVLMDPPWEAQYDLGYYRPGDNIPTDIYWLPLHGYGPPLRGSNY
jgi:hypothetical protein